MPTTTRTDLRDSIRTIVTMAGRGLGTPACCAAALALAATAATPVQAQQAQAQARSSTTLEEVKVTARKREESLQDVPLSVQAVSGDTLDQLGVHDLASLQSLTPGLTLFQNTDRSYGQVFLRGMSNVVPVGDTTRELASIFIDGVYYVGAIPVLALDSVERVEVVKGPQSALYGRSTFSGAINLVTRVPQDKLAGSVGIRLGQDNEAEWTGSVEGPLLPGVLTGRIYGRLREYDGQYTNSIGGGRVGAEEDEAWGIQLHFTPADWVDAKLNYMHQRQSDGPAASQLIGRQPTHNCGPFPPATRTMVCGEVEYTGGKDGVALNLAPPAAAWPSLPRTDPGLDRSFSFISANVAFNLPADMTLTYLGGYSEEEFTNLYDFDRTGTDAYWSLALRKQHSFSHELRLASASNQTIAWLVGASIVEQSNYNSGRFINGSLPAFGASVGALGAPNVVDRDLKNTGVFGSLTWNITDQLSATAEVRRQRDESTDFISPTLTLNPTTDSTLPRFIIDWKPLGNLKLYASYAEGNRPLTTNPSLAALSPANLAAFEARYGVGAVTREETIDNYEIGAKWTLDRGYVNVAAYTGKWHDQQAVSSFTYDFNGNGTIDLIGVPPDRREFHTASINTGELDVEGLELEAQYAVTDRFLLGANAAWNSSKFTSGVDASLTPNLGSPNVAGKYMALVPRFSGTATATYAAPFGADKDWFVRGDVVYVGSRYSDTSNTGETGASTDLNLVAGIRWSAIEISAYVNNVFDDETVESLRIQGDTGLDPFTFNRRAYEAVLPRRQQFGVAATLRF